MARTAVKKATSDKKTIAWNEAALQHLIESRYSAPEFATFLNLRNGTGYQKREQYADALAMGMYPSRGLEIHGFEIKTNRSDWLKELKDPAKAEDFFQYCDYWWLVAPSEIVKKNEIPKTWGWLRPHGSTSLRVAAQAPLLDPKGLDRVFIASILRQGARKYSKDRYILKKDVDRMIRKDLQQAREDGRNAQRESYKFETREINELKQSLKEFEEKSGIRISAWDGGSIGQAVNLTMQIRNNIKPLQNALAHTKDLHKQSSQLLEVLGNLFDLK